MIRRLQYHEIDFEKYQRCIENSEQKKYSGEKIFLDNTAQKNWELLVYGDYEAVMPIPFVKKWGLKIVVHPKLTQQLGVFSYQDSSDLNEMFLSFFRKEYRIWYYAFNEFNQFKTALSKRKNFILYPSSYEEIQQKYSPKRKRKLRLNPGVKEFSEIKEGIGFLEAKTFIKKHIKGVKKAQEIDEYVSILQFFYDQNRLDFYGFYYKKVLVNLVAIYQEKYTAVLLGTYNNQQFIKLNGASCLVDFAIMKNIEQKIFDFEGGDLPHLDEYFRGFRALQKTYPVIRNSKIKLLLNIFKNP